MATRILVPLDGSCPAEKALCCAVQWAAQLAAELVLFRSVSIPRRAQKALDRAGIESGLLAERLEAKAGEYLTSVTQHRFPDDGGPSVGCIVQRGPPAAAIVDYARQAGIDLIVMAAHHRDGIQRWTHACVADRVLRTSNVPVLLVNAQEMDAADSQSRGCKRILVPLDGSPMAEQVLSPATALTKALGCEMVLFQSSIAFLFECSTLAAERMAEGYLLSVADRLRPLGIKVSTAVRTGPVVETIVQFAKTNHVDMIAMCTHARTGIVRCALGSVADRVMRAGSIPVLVVRAKRGRQASARERLLLSARAA